jgi:hypothetical protein
MTMDAHDALLRALTARIGRDQPLALRAAHSEAWASATFSGSRHSFAFALTGQFASATASRLAQGLDVMEFHLPGHLVADITLVDRRDTPDSATFAIEALTVEDR